MDNSIKNKIREELVNVARKKITIPYGILASRVGLDSYPNWFHLISGYLDRINEEEVADGRPMITAIVVREDNGIPGDGFWVCAFYTCKLWDGKGSKIDFWKEELNRVWDYWSKH